MPSDGTAVPDYPALIRLDGKRFLVAGAGFGIGRQAAHALASVGAEVACVDLIEDRASTVAAEVGGVACVADLRRGPDVERAISESVAALGGIDGIIDIVGEARWSRLVDMEESDWDATLDQNLRHAFLILKFGVPELARAGAGVVTFVSSMDGIFGAPYHSAYGVAKAGVVSLVRSAAAELRRNGIRINAVAPGPTATPRLVEALGVSADGTLTGWGNPCHVASVLLFLSSDLARHVSGQTLLVDGGATSESPMPLPEAFVKGIAP